MQRFVQSLTAIAVLVTTSHVGAQDAAALPASKQLFAKCVDAMGGAKELKKIESATLEGRADIPEYGLNGPVVMNYRKGELHVEIEFNGQKTIQGVTDKKGWELSPTEGARIMSETETEKLLNNVTMKSYLDPESTYKETKTVGKKKVGDEECYQVKLVRKQDDGEEEVCFSTKTGLPKQTTNTRSTNFGEIKIITTISEYKEVGKLKMPGKMSSKIEQLNMTYSLTVTSSKYNEPIDESAFTVPDDVKTLLEN